MSPGSKLIARHSRLGTHMYADVPTLQIVRVNAVTWSAGTFRFDTILPSVITQTV